MKVNLEVSDFKRLLLTFLLCISCQTLAVQPELQLANVYSPKVYNQSVDLKNYWISEKYDGYRAYWDGQQLVSRQGLVFSAPEWFIKNFPQTPLDGELWIGRGKFEQLASIVKRQQPHPGWGQVSFMVFDLPASEKTFDQRLLQLETLISTADSPYLKRVSQFKLQSHEALMRELQQRVSAGAEGLMLHRGSALYRSGRSNDLLKLKPLQDMEAKVLEHLPGKGRNKDRMGSLLVEISSGIRFRLGGGFSDEERETPPAVGAIVTFQYSGFTARGVPRFARFLRVRDDLSWSNDG